MRAVKVAIASTVLGALVALGAGCGGSDPDAARTPTDAVTVTNGETGEATDTSGEGGGNEAAAAGKTFFEGTCQACHPAGGTEAGMGPKLEGIGWNEAQITKQVQDGGGAMPGGLASGADLENVVAYVVSLQGGAAGGGGETTASTEKPKPTPAPAATTAGDDDSAPAGDVAAGKSFFEGTCQACHPAGGASAGVGPALKGIGWSVDKITEQVEKGGGAMPGGLASGENLTNVVAYVASLQ